MASWLDAKVPVRADWLVSVCCLLLLDVLSAMDWLSTVRALLLLAWLVLTVRQFVQFLGSRR